MSYKLNKTYVLVIDKTKNASSMLCSKPINYPQNAKQRIINYTGHQLSEVNIHKWKKNTSIYNKLVSLICINIKCEKG